MATTTISNQNAVVSSCFAFHFRGPTVVTCLNRDRTSGNVLFHLSISCVTWANAFFQGAPTAIMFALCAYQLDPIGRSFEAFKFQPLWNIFWTRGTSGIGELGWRLQCGFLSTPQTKHSWITLGVILSSCCEGQRDFIWVRWVTQSRCALWK